MLCSFTLFVSVGSETPNWEVTNEDIIIILAKHIALVWSRDPEKNREKS